MGIATVVVSQANHRFVPIPDSHHQTHLPSDRQSTPALDPERARRGRRAKLQIQRQRPPEQPTNLVRSSCRPHGRGLCPTPASFRQCSLTYDISVYCKAHVMTPLISRFTRMCIYKDIYGVHACVHRDLFFFWRMYGVCARNASQLIMMVHPIDRLDVFLLENFYHLSLFSS